MVPIPELLFLAGRGLVVGLNKRTGQEVWRTSLRSGWFNWGSSYVGLVEGTDHLYACANGQVSCLSKDEGRVLWQSKVSDLGFFPTITVDGVPLAARGVSSSLPQQLLMAQQAAALQKAVSGPGF